MVAVESSPPWRVWYGTTTVWYCVAWCDAAHRLGERPTRLGETQAQDGGACDGEARARLVRSIEQVPDIDTPVGAADENHARPRRTPCAACEPSVGPDPGEGRHEERRRHAVLPQVEGPVTHRQVDVGHKRRALERGAGTVVAERVRSHAAGDGALGALGVGLE